VVILHHRRRIDLLKNIILLVILAVLLWAFVHNSRRKWQFRSIKKKYGIAKDDRYNLESITRLLLRFNQMVETPLLYDDYAIIKLDGALLLLLYGDVGYTGSWWAGIRNYTRPVTYLIIEDDEISKTVQKHQDLFELAMRKEDITVFWVRDLRKLSFYLREQERLKSASVY